MWSFSVDPAPVQGRTWPVILTGRGEPVHRYGQQSVHHVRLPGRLLACPGDPRRERDQFVGGDVGAHRTGLLGAVQQSRPSFDLVDARCGPDSPARPAFRVLAALRCGRGNAAQSAISQLRLGRCRVAQCAEA